MPSETYLKARELVGEAYERLLIARHYAPLIPIRTAEKLVLQTLIALYDVEDDVLDALVDAYEEPGHPPF